MTARIAILGPTAAGKSALAVAVARATGGTVINGDPFQAFRDLPVGTGQPSPAEFAGAPHEGYGLLPVRGNYDGVSPLLTVKGLWANATFSVGWEL